MKDIYRVVRENYIDTPSGPCTESTRVVYCGNDMDEARLAYHRWRPEDREPERNHGRMDPGNEGQWTESPSDHTGVRTRFQRIRPRAKGNA